MFKEGRPYQPPVEEYVPFTLQQPQPQSGLREAVGKADAAIASIDSVLGESSLPTKGLVFQSPIRSERVTPISRTEKQSQDYFLSSKWLEDHVAKERQKPVKAGETPWYHLAGTGFWVKEQVSQLIRNTKGAMYEVALAVVDRELNKVKVDMLAFEDEYLKQMLNLRFHLAWKDVAGEKRIVCPDYGNELWESVTDKKEREGAVYDALFGNKEKGEGGLEEKLRDAENGSMGIAMSNEGWSGMYDADGKSIHFKESQIYLIKKLENGELQAYTIRYKANILQNEILQRRLGLYVPAAANGRERIKQLMKNTAILSPGDAVQAEAEGRKPIREFTDVVDLIRDTVDRDTAYGNKTFDEINQFLQNPEAFTKHNELTEQLISRFQQFARNELVKHQSKADLEANLQIAIAFTILQMNKMYRMQEENSHLDGSLQQAEPFSMMEAMMQMEKIAYFAEVQMLKERPGCAGGGIAQSYLQQRYMSLNALRAQVQGGGLSEQDQFGPLRFECAGGHWNKRPRGELIPNCTTCGESVAC